MYTNQSNNLKYSTTKIVGTESITVNITLNDECKNGHQDFSITAEIYEPGKPKTDKYLIAAGCQHDVILNHFPELKQFIELHLSDVRGIPMYAVENGYYHIHHMLKDKYCEYYRIDPTYWVNLFEGIRRQKRQ